MYELFKKILATYSYREKLLKINQIENLTFRCHPKC